MSQSQSDLRAQNYIKYVKTLPWLCLVVIAACTQKIVYWPRLPKWNWENIYWGLLLPAYVLRWEVMFSQVSVWLYLTWASRTSQPLVPGPFQGVPQLLVPSQPLVPSNFGEGGVTPVLSQVLPGGGYTRTGPPARTGVPPGTGYTAGGMPLAVSRRRTFSSSFKIMLKCIVPFQWCDNKLWRLYINQTTIPLPYWSRNVLRAFKCGTNMD